MGNDPLTREGPPREHQEEMGDGPLALAQRGAGCPHPPLFPKEHGERVDDRKVLTGIIHVIQKGLRWMDALPRAIPGSAGIHTLLLAWCRAATHSRFPMPAGSRGGRVELASGLLDGSEQLQ